MQILKYPNRILRQECKKVYIFDSAVRRLASSMLETMVKADGIGLSGPQIGVCRQIFVMGDKDKFWVCINPEIMTQSGEQVKEEGCLSFPGMVITTKRSEAVTLKFNDLKGKCVIEKFNGLLAQYVQHEVDHLHGRLFGDT